VPLALPDFPWNSLIPFRETAAAHPDGIVDLAIGSPVDPVPELIRDALAAAVDAPGYPATQGSPEVRAAIVDWYARHGIEIGVENAIPTIGSKEFIATLPTLLGLGAGDVVVYPTVAYPTYEVGARIAGAEPAAADDPDDWPANTRLVWLNSPGNPDGKVHGLEFLRRAVVKAREIGAVVANDECYTELNWEGDAATPSILHPEVTQGSRRLTLAVHSLSKRSNLAGYRAGFVAGCSDLIAEILEARKHAGLIPPAPVQHAMAVALGDDAHVAVQKARYAERRESLRSALEGAGFRIDESRAGLYLWATRGEDCWATVGELADLGILATPGSFYGVPSGQHVRFSLTATDERVAAAVARLAPSSN
jgi:succinyldiaminopimelate transaminase